jgi:AraC-like DNA-binding protein
MEETERIDQMIFSPTSRLSQDIKCFWILEGAKQVYQHNEIIPDPYVELVINYGAPIFLNIKDGNRIELPSVYVGHLQTQPQRLHTTGKSQVIAIRFYPWAVSSLLLNDATCCYMNIAALNGDWQRFAMNDLRKKLDNKEYSEAVAVLQQFVLDRWERVLAQAALVQKAGQLLYKTGGQVGMEALAAHCALSARQLERRFKHFTGVTPKTYARLVRFDAFCRNMITNPAYNLVDLAHESGYSDQAHLTHEFKSLAGCTPRTLATRAQEYIKECQNDDFLQDT